MKSKGLEELLNEIYRRALRRDMARGKIATPEHEIAHNIRILVHQYSLKERDQRVIARAWTAFNQLGRNLHLFEGLNVSNETREAFREFVKPPPKSPSMMLPRGKKGRR